MIYNDPNFFKKKQYTVTIEKSSSFISMSSPYVTINDTKYTATYSGAQTIVVDDGTVIYCRCTSAGYSEIYLNGTKLKLPYSSGGAEYYYTVHCDASITLEYKQFSSYDRQYIYIVESE